MLQSMGLYYMEPKRFNLLQAGLEFGLIIAIPLILLIGLGLWLDKKYDTIPVFILSGLFLALGISSYMLYKRINEMLNNK